ncbi:hypothetical protein NIES4072_59690 [Nostoc commune NIES-4072]|uniref:Uncharacterized protein n=1 Tax=Nostoc commune NIES-4072 TaxID=2005467 RepID=A0A2R5G2G7_NOSCO|nr:hypothetical protein [Nostoc commune]BBD66756.1 hypothetical protein NIES4070_31250 [Nostoc commune HK-02]GBG22261.1 hypothetical protein NIES4072_59690 [Nostoc commune NIES-4072]
MSTQFFLDETDIDTLINLLLRSQQSRTREALCFSIGIDPKRLSFIRDSSDSDFFLLLIRHLNEIGEQEALCKLCCKELSPVFRHGNYATILSEIAAKLNCNQRLSQNFTNNQQPTFLSSSPAPSVNVNTFIQLAKNKFIRYSVIVIIGLAGFVSFIQSSKLTSSLPQDGNVISLECLGKSPTGLKWLISDINNNVSLASNIDAHAKWKIQVISDQEVALENQGVINNNSKWLDGVTVDGSVKLAPSTESPYTGTHWRIKTLSDGVVALDNQGKSKWLDGVTEDGSVKLAPNIGKNYTGTHWRISKQ